jgi:hypothetical protein
MDAACSWLQDHASVNPLQMQQHAYKEQIENAVFQHKLILIGNKILQDTVAPAEHWTLKQAAKRGCSCCLLDDDEDDEDENGKPVTNNGAALPGITNVSGKGLGYVDGKVGFAFDPSKFT